MKQNSSYASPAVLRALPLLLEGAILSGSVVDHVEVTSVGQEVEDYDFNDPDFNHNWE